MKQRFHNINNIGFTNYHRIIFIYKLCTIYRDSFRLSNPYYTRHRQRLNDAVPTYKRGIIILHLNIRSHPTRNVLQLTYKIPNSVRIRYYSVISHNRGSLYGVRITMRTNIILGSHSNYKYNFSYPLCRQRSNTMTMGKLLSITTHTKPIFLPTFSNPSSNCSISLNSPNVTPQDRVF